MLLIRSRKLLIIAILNSISCSPIDPAMAVKLANQGKTWATTVRTLESETRVGLHRYVESQIWVSINGQKPPPSETQLIEIQKIQVILAARGLLMETLISTYDSFQKLASYNAADEVEQALNGLTEATNNYGKALGATEAPIPNATGLLVGKASGLIASEIQKQQLLRSSELIRARLLRVQAFIGRELAAHRRMRSLIINANAEAAAELVKHGLGDPQPILESLLGNFGMNYDRVQGLAILAEARKRYTDELAAYEAEKKKKGTAKEPGAPAWLSALTEIVRYRALTELAVQEDIVNEIGASLEEVKRAHEKFEVGEDLNIENLTQRLILLRQFLEQLKNLKA